MTYMFDGRQFIAVAAGPNIITFAIRDSEGSDSDHGCVARRPPVMMPKFNGIARPTGNDVKATRPP